MATNFEFYKDKILNEFIKEYQMHCFALAMEIVTGVEFHIGCECGKCSSCEKIVFEWLYAEHIEQPKLTKRERAFCEAVQVGWIARDECGGLYFYEEAPTKHGILWSSNSGIYELPETIWELFSFAKWEDEKPWSVEDLLKLEVEECNTSET